MDIKNLEIPEIKLIRPRVFSDDRGFFMQTYHKEQYQEAGVDVPFVQDNYSQSGKGTVRGLHYQLEHPQDKLVSVTHGEVFDVVVDIRRGSPSFGQWVGETLSAENKCQLFVPKGFAHGFCVLSEQADLVYKCSDFYAPDDEYGILWSDPAIGIDWPLNDVLLSGKDLALPVLADITPDYLPVYHQG